MKGLKRINQIFCWFRGLPIGPGVGLLAGVLVLFVTAGHPVRGASVPGKHELPTAKVSSDSMLIMRGRDWYGHLYRRIQQAEESIDVAMYIWSSSRHRMGSALLKNLKKRMDDGVDVRVVLDGSIDENWTTSAKLIERGARVKLWQQPGSMHSKFAVIDQKRVYAGSANWSISAFNRSEETTVYFESPILSEAFTVRFESIWELSI